MLPGIRELKEMNEELLQRLDMIVGLLQILVDKQDNFVTKDELYGDGK